jgi:hypothetical protein
MFVDVQDKTPGFALKPHGEKRAAFLPRLRENPGFLRRDAFFPGERNGRRIHKPLSDGHSVIEVRPGCQTRLANGSDQIAL